MTEQRTTAPTQPGLFPADDTIDDHPVARPLQVTTRGRDELVVRCPRCAQMHRHTGLGLRRGPCGAVYTVQPKRRAGRAA